MPEYLRAFVVVTTMMALAYLISRRLFSRAVGGAFINHLFCTGFAATCILFLAQDIWLFLFGLAIVSIIAARTSRYPFAIFVFLLLLMPGYSIQVPGFGVINYLIKLNALNVLSLTLLLPAALNLSIQPNIPRPGHLFTDKIAFAYVICTTYLTILNLDSVTGGMRHIVTLTLDFVLIYFVASRALMDKNDVRRIVVAFVMAAIFLALIGSFEFYKQWMLYSHVEQTLDVDSALYGYLRRGELLRASATTGQPIVLGFVMMVALILSVYVQWFVIRGSDRMLLWIIMGMGLVAAMSRGPWVGAAVGLLVVALASDQPVKNGLKYFAVVFCFALFLLIWPNGEKIIDYLPWIGSIDSETITFREILWEQSIVVIERNFWTGSIFYEKAAEFDEIRSRTGFVDIVNSYIQQALSFGMIGLFLYVMLIVAAIISTFLVSFQRISISTETRAYGVALVGCLIAISLTIWTVSSISQISAIVTILTGAAVATKYLPMRMGEERVRRSFQ